MKDAFPEVFLSIVYPVDRFVSIVLIAQSFALLLSRVAMMRNLIGMFDLVFFKLVTATAVVVAVHVVNVFVIDET